jgi:CRP/FNR family cyclic AMP-dependent transcriptional regulator
VASKRKYFDRTNIVQGLAKEGEQLREKKEKVIREETIRFHRRRMRIIMEINTTILATQPFFKGLPERYLEVLASAAIPVEFAAGKQIFNAGSPANRFYLLTGGEVALESSGDERDDERKPVLIETIGAGDVLGWSWIFPPYCWHFDARAISPVKAIFFYGSRLREQCEQDHDLGYELMRRTAEVVIGRLQATRRQLLETGSRPLQLM